MTRKQYVLITPARNEEGNIERLIESVLSQTILPKKWIIVSDGSTDRTDKIVAGYAEKHELIHPVSTGKQGRGDFASKALAFKAGYEKLGDAAYEFLGNLDADLSFDADYFERILGHFEADPKLGIAGGIIWELVGNRFVPSRTSLNSVAGAVQLFRRECYQSIGGYIPLEKGGIDAAAQIMARMRGWRVQTFPELLVRHHRRVLTGSSRILSTRFREGMTNYLLGYHPFFQIMSCSYRVIDRPYLVGTLHVFAGYIWASLQRHKRAVPDDVVKFLRSEQMARLARPFARGKQEKSTETSSLNSLRF
jgi:glycosyltransferase involved in cell wall biosynthesis